MKLVDERFEGTLILFLSLFCCLLAVNVFAGDNTMSEDTFKELDSEKWSVLATKNIYFGHHSVGTNIIAGIEDLLTAAIPGRPKFIV